ncbi:VPLPA-CTERM-specific exosortase XrtD [Nitrincola schmidtii]|uniref:VPLPA-CTERM-specific exosortase XrtD n=1 Tax=Nitrincola schmidtii TaxID=1730894 RepID=UPI00198263FC|nr:VPLPA-CTERM-specific exosortase XrtD [Nitrincola schmidtii]
MSIIKEVQQELALLKPLISWPTMALFGFALLASFFLAFGGLTEVVERWIKQEEYSHGFLIPLVSLYILWEKRLMIATDFKSGTWLGMPVIAAALIIAFIGEISALYILVQYSFLLLLAGFAITALGKAAKHTVIPIVLLVFAIPLPYFLEAVLTARLQLWSSEIGVMFIKMMGIPVYLSGNIIDLGTYKLQVVEACSGLSYLFPLTCLGFIAAYFYQAPLWKRAVLFLSTIPITILMNSFRIGVTGWLVNGWGISHAEGFLHDFEGWIIFVACAAILALEIEILERITTRRGLFDVFGLNVENPTPQAFEAARQRQSGSTLPVPMLVMVTLTFVFALGVQAFDRRDESAPVNISLAAFPDRIDDWRGSHGNIDTRTIEVLQLTDYLMMNFERENEPLVNFYVAYYASQRKGVSPHSPRVCIPGGGWEIADIRRTYIDDIPVNRVIIRRGLESQLVYYWFQERGEPIANEYVKKWNLLTDALRYNRTDGALVRVVTPFHSTEPVEVAEQRLKEFVRAAYPELVQVLPKKGDL